jgi:hypothetical protein
MDQNFGSCLPKFFSRDKIGKPGGEKEIRGKKSSQIIVLRLFACNESREEPLPIQFSPPQ